MNEDQRRGDDDLVARLERIGNRTVDVPASRLDATWERVQSAMNSDEGDRHSAVGLLVEGDPRGARRRTSLAPRIVVAAASIVAVIALSVALFGTGDDALVVAAADDVTVVLPGGEAVSVVDGTELVDGSILEVVGFVEVGGRRYGPGRYRIDDGQVVPIDDGAVEVVSTDDVTGNTDIEEPASSPTDRTRPDGATVSATDRTPESAPPVTASPPTRPPSTQPTSTRPSTTSPTRTTAPERPAPQTTVPVSAPTSAPAPTRPSTTERTTSVERPTTSGVRPTTTTTTTTATTTTTTPNTTVVRGRDGAEEADAER